MRQKLFVSPKIHSSQNSDFSFRMRFNTSFFSISEFSEETCPNVPQILRPTTAEEEEHEKGYQRVFKGNYHPISLLSFQIGTSYT